MGDKLFDMMFFLNACLKGEAQAGCNISIILSYENALGKLTKHISPITSGVTYYVFYALKVSFCSVAIWHQLSHLCY